jgi:hypothetical protein
MITAVPVVAFAVGLYLWVAATIERQRLAEFGLRRRFFFPSISPRRFSMSPIVLLDGQCTPGCSLPSSAHSFRGPQVGYRSRGRTTSSSMCSEVLCGM